MSSMLYLAIISPQIYERISGLLSIPFYSYWNLYRPPTLLSLLLLACRRTTKSFYEVRHIGLSICLGSFRRTKKREPPLGQLLTPHEIRIAISNVNNNNSNTNNINILIVLIVLNVPVENMVLIILTVLARLIPHVNWLSLVYSRSLHRIDLCILSGL